MKAVQVHSSAPVPMVVGGASPAPRAVIDYDFTTVLAAPPRRRLVLWLMIALIAATAAALAVAKVNVIVSANGRLATSASEIVVQPLETSVVRSIAVKMGDKVKAGAVLAELDPTFAAADQTGLTAKLQHLQASYDRLSAEAADRTYAPAHPNQDETTQVAIWQKRQQEYAARLAAAERKVGESEADLTAHKTEADGLAQQIKLSGDAQGIYQALVDKNLASRLKLIETTQRLVDAKSRLATNLGEQQHLQQQIAGSTAEREAFVSDWKRKVAEDLAKTRSDRDQTAAELSKARLRHRLSVLRAPSDAIVLEVADRPAGAVIRPAEPLFRLVPADAPLVADIQIDTRDVARLKPGDAVTLKFEALPWQQFGLADGILQTLAPDSEADDNPRATSAEMAAPGLKPMERASVIHYRARVELTNTRFHNLPPGFVLRPGMRLVADVNIGRRSILNYVLNPVTGVISDSLREP